jgi:membrane-associated protein
MHTLLFLFRPEAIIEYGGLALLLLIIFAETGLFFGFFLPGDSLLFVAGILCDTKYIALPVWLLIGLVIIAAVLGTTVGYGFGHWAKRYLDNRKENFFYRRRYMDVTQQFYHRYGMYSFVLGRFLPVVRTFVPILAGVVRVDFRNFFFFNVIGAVAWAAPVILAGYWLGGRFPSITEHLDIIIAGMFLVSGLPIVLSWWRYKRSLGTN